MCVCVCVLPVHGLTGSMFGCDVLDDLVAAGRVVSSEAAGKMCSGWPFTIKGHSRSRMSAYHTLTYLMLCYAMLQSSIGRRT